MSVKKLLNPDAQGTNILKLHTSASGCCKVGDLKLCKYVVTGDVTQGVTAAVFEVDGANVTKTFDAVNTKSAVRKKLNEVIRELGYDPFYEDEYKGVNATDTSVFLISELKLVSLTINGSAVNATQYCEMNKVSEYTIEIDTDTSVAPGISINGQTATAIGDNSGYASGAASTFLSELTTALTAQLTALGKTWKKLNVVEDTIAGVFNVTIHIEGDNVVQIGGASMTRVRAYPEFTA